MTWRTTRAWSLVVDFPLATFLVPEGAAAPPVGFVPAVSVSPADFDRLTEIPIQIVFGDNIAAELTGLFGVDLWVRSLPAAESFVETINGRGGDAEVLHLPEAGVRGNTHFPFSDLNNLEVAELLSQFLSEKALDHAAP